MHTQTSSRPPKQSTWDDLSICQAWATEGGGSNYIYCADIVNTDKGAWYEALSRTRTSEGGMTTQIGQRVPRLEIEYSLTRFVTYLREQGCAVPLNARRVAALERLARTVDPLEVPA